ncbi:hypothetical protein IMG5_108810 [Ichthyophthirius multifiliis]|uniref:Uncharacterized protein n=1 Tax=Ichthyophthirius multifiliis TaxID=5932 RepID=G0QTI3_ICHMU|nr:hypothetical protein IMG5_108810 [Ichthyophthirius multifiliis]EGR31468.1 hypothetical protein IMG5_108810 [Ichthyophthirius multifiliis]|eukprot:XP_004034954.1 hypothetical protein IMG5_108810 [Ichthyophthirius multifiliis]
MNTSSFIKEEEKKNNNPEIKNAVERLIKLDKKHANFEFYDPIINLKVKVRNINSASSNAILNQNQQEKTLRCFWRHISNYYFRKIDQSEQERIEYLQQLTNEYTQVKLKNQKAQIKSINQVFRTLINTQAFKQNKLNLQNLQIACNIEYLLYENQNKANKKKLQILQSQKNYTISKTLNYKILENEQKKLIEIQNDLQELEEQKQQQETGDQLTLEMRYLMKELQNINEQNKDKILQLDKKVKQEIKENKLIYFECDDNKEIPNNINYNPNFQKELGLTDPRAIYNEKYINELHLKYLQQTIIKLDEKQVADSISKITNCKKERKMIFF